MAEFVNSGTRRSEFCQRRGLSFSTLDRHLKKRRWKKKRARSVPADGQLLPWEIGHRPRVYRWRIHDVLLGSFQVYAVGGTLKKSELCVGVVAQSGPNRALISVQGRESCCLNLFRTTDQSER